MKLTLPALIAFTGFAAAQDTPPTYDTAALAPILSHSWAEGGCEAPASVVDWVIDTDGWAYQRDAGGGFTPLMSMTFADGKLSVADEVGIGRSDLVYWMREDGALRLWSERFSEGDDGEDAGPPMEHVKDGKIVIGDDGQPVAKPAETPALMPCSPRTTLYSGEVVTALGGTWADKEGGSCGKGTGALRFEFARPVPRVQRGPIGDIPEGESFLLSAEKDGDGWIVTEGSAFEATPYRYTIGKDGTLNQSPAYEGEKPRSYERCPG